MLTLQWRDVDLKAGVILIRAENTKDGKDRPIPISSRLAAVLEMGRTDPAGEPHGPTGFVFGNEAGEQIKSPKKAWENACRKAKIDDLRFHDLRHEAGSRLHELGWPLHHVRDLLGHASLSTTNTYLNVSRAELIASMRRADEARKSGTNVAHEGVKRPPTSSVEPTDDKGKSLLH